MLQISHNSLTIINVTKSVTWIATTSRQGKALIFETKVISFYTTECFRGYKSSLVVKSGVGKSDRLVPSKI